jgi:glyoxylase-like metal-dependent hydrolase (beta-lactamase superfamily II)
MTRVTMPSNRWTAERISVLNVHEFRVGVNHSYLIESEDGIVLVDTGYRGNEHSILRRLHTLGRDDLRLIYITHAHLDHYGSAAALRRLTGAPIAVHREDAEAMTRGDTPLGVVRSWGRLMKMAMPLVERYLRPEPTVADILFEGGESLEEYGINGVVLHTPGHTPGSTTLLVDGRLAFVGDLASTRMRPHAQWFYATDWTALGKSIERLQGLNPEWVYTGHGERPMTGDAFQKIKVKTS